MRTRRPSLQGDKTLLVFPVENGPLFRACSGHSAQWLFESGQSHETFFQSSSTKNLAGSPEANSRASHPPTHTHLASCSSRHTAPAALAAGAQPRADVPLPLVLPEPSGSTPCGLSSRVGPEKLDILSFLNCLLYERE